MPLHSGHKLAHYEIHELVGRGGMGEVYQAKDSKLGRDVAIKVLPDEFAQDEERLRRFQREAKVLASLNHPNIAAIYGLEQSGDTHYLVLELVPGETLADRIARGPIPVEEALENATKIAEALEEAHEQGIVHRDLKPANIKLTPDDKIKVLDFGLAKALEGDEAGSADSELSKSPTLTRQTQVGTILGTASYMSPEQAKGKRVDRRADVWAFGCILHEMVTGSKAFDGEGVSDVLASVLAREPDFDRLPADLHPRLRELLRRCLDKDPKKRWQAVGDLRVEIETVVADPDPIFVTAPARGLGFRGHLAWGLAAIVAAVAAGIIGATLTEAPERPLTRFVLEPRPGQTIGTNPLPGNDLAISSDGRFLVYAAVENGLQQLYFRPLDAFEATVLPDTETGYAPFLSPDGQWLGFFVGTRLFKMQLPNGRRLEIANLGVSNLAGASWGDDGRIVIGRRSEGLVRVSASGGDLEILTTPDLASGEAQHLWPEVLPGGNAVLFTVFRHASLEGARLAALRLDTGELTFLLEDEGYAPQYVNTGHVVYGRAGVVMAVPFEVDRLATTGPPAQILDGLFTKPSGAQARDVSDDGTLVYIPGENTDVVRSIIWVDRSGEAVPLGDVPPDNYKSVRLSPNRREIAIALNTSVPSSILVFDTENWSRTGLTPTGTSADSPLWTPDGAGVTYQADDGSIRLQMADGSGSPETLLKSEAALVPAAWTPDGSTLVYGDELGDIFWYRNGESHKFLDSDATEMAQSLSPDGRFLAYVSDEVGRFEVYVRPFPGPGGARWQISDGGGTDAVFSRDGRELFYLSRSGMVAVAIETEPTFRHGRQTKLFPRRIPAGGGVPPRYDYDPDTRRFLMVQEEEYATTLRIHVVLDWTEELKRLVPTNN